MKKLIDALMAALKGVAGVEGELADQVRAALAKFDPKAIGLVEVGDDQTVINPGG